MSPAAKSVLCISWGKRECLQIRDHLVSCWIIRLFDWKRTPQKFPKRYFRTLFMHVHNLFVLKNFVTARSAFAIVRDHWQIDFAWCLHFLGAISIYRSSALEKHGQPLEGRPPPHGLRAGAEGPMPDGWGADEWRALRRRGRRGCGRGANECECNDRSETSACNFNDHAPSHFGMELILHAGAPSFRWRVPLS